MVSVGPQVQGMAPAWRNGGEVKRLALNRCQTTGQAHPRLLDKLLIRGERVPKSGGGVVGAGQQEPPIGREGDRANLIHVAGQRPNLLPGRRLP